MDELVRVLQGGPDIGGHPLRDEWEGCFTVHVARDRYRVIWTELPAEAGYEDDEEIELVPIVILRVGPKTDAQHRTIYDEPPPELPFPQ